jgi:NADH:ubiquinone oxidoreductase subunit H
MTGCPVPNSIGKIMFWFCNLYTSPMLLLLFHGGWDTIALALLYWAVIIGLPLLVIFIVVRAVVRRVRRHP